MLGSEVEYGPAIAWRRDPLSGKETPRDYFRFIPYLDAQVAGDHKVIWEINRHQHLVLLAQAFVTTGNLAYSETVFRQLEDWWNDNPFQRGINWASALEVGFRALSWIWIWHLLGSKMSQAFRQRFFAELYRHGLHLEYNLSIYFSPNTHLLGEAVALHALGRLFPDWPRSVTWRERGGSIVREQMSAQVRADGSHFEQSTYYHVYALDFFLFHAVVEEVPDDYRDGLSRMSEFLAAVLSPAGELPLIGDDDGGRVFYPFGPCEQFGLGTLAVASLLLDRAFDPNSDAAIPDVALWWLGPKKSKVRTPSLAPQRSRSFGDSGLVAMKSGDVSALFDAGPFGPFNGGHSHADALSLIVWKGRREILIDPGTYRYMDLEWRDAFRGTAAHNTIRIDGTNQAAVAGPFGWANKPQVRLISFSSTADEDCAVAVCEYQGFIHKRTVRFRKPNEFEILDDVDGHPGEHLIEQYWHPATSVQEASPGAWRIGLSAQLTLEGGQCEDGWRSQAFGSKQRSPVIKVRRRAMLPVQFQAQLRMGM